MVCPRKCLFCGEGTAPKRRHNTEDSVIAAWDNECISILSSILFHSADESHKKTAEDILRSASYCESCKLDLRDLSLSHRIIFNARRQMAKLIEKIVQNVSSNFGKTSPPRKSNRNGTAESVSALFSELQEEDWVLQPFEYIESAVLRSFIHENDSPIIEPVFDEETLEENSFTIVKEELELTGLEIELDSDFNPLEDFDPLEAPVTQENEMDEHKIESYQGDALGSINEGAGDSDELPDSDFSVPDESELSEACDDSGDDYEPPLSKRKLSKKTSSSNVNSKYTRTTLLKSRKTTPAKTSESSSSCPKKRKQKPRMSAEQMQKSLQQFPVKCRYDNCYQRFRSEIRMVGHFNKYHDGDHETPYRCTLCIQDGGTKSEEIVGFKQFVDLQKHVRSVHKTALPCDNLLTKHKCSYCEKHFWTLSDLAAHVASKHEKKSIQGACNVCNKRFETVEEMETHNSRIHQGKYPFTCEDCNKIFSDGVALRFHVKQLHSLHDRVMCQICKDKSFLTKERLKFHEYANHPELRGAKFHCVECDLTFKNYYYFRDHKIDFHPELVKSKDHKCHECNKTYKKINQLTSHQERIHSSSREKKYRCSLCPALFASLGSVKSHEKIHSGVKYICHICASQFTSQSRLIAHVKRLHAEGTESKVRKPRKPRTSQCDNQSSFTESKSTVPENDDTVNHPTRTEDDSNPSSSNDDEDYNTPSSNDEDYNTPSSNDDEDYDTPSSNDDEDDGSNPSANDDNNDNSNPPLTNSDEDDNLELLPIIIL